MVIGKMKNENTIKQENYIIAKAIYIIDNQPSVYLKKNSHFKNN